MTVKDTGVGIPPDRLGSIFEMFMQVDRASERSQGGLGIGLTLVKRLVEMHGGSVEARSEGSGRGSEFVVRLPLTEDGPKAHERPAAGRRVPVVDAKQDGAESLHVVEGHRQRDAHGL